MMYIASPGEEEEGGGGDWPREVRKTHAYALFVTHFQHRSVAIPALAVVNWMKRLEYIISMI